MRKLIIVLVFILFLPLTAYSYEFAENWTKTDTAYQSAFITLATVDWMQTRWMTRHDWQWDGEYHKEINPFLGSHPSESKINTIIPISILAHTVVAMALPPKARRIWQCVFIGIEGLAIGNNYIAGVGIDF